MTYLIQLKIKNKYFKKGNLELLKDFRLNVLPGERIAVTGASGVGKTSLLNILGLIDQNYTGDYLLFNQDAKQFSSQEAAQIRNEKIGFILQESSLINSLSLADNIKLPLLYSKQSQDVTKYYQQLTQKLGIQAILSKKPLECSGGQRSRVAIARALILKPQIILADEPTASLDEGNKAHVLEILKDLNQLYGSTIITVTHDSQVAEKHQRIIHLG